MIARSVSFHLKPGRAADFAKLLDTNIIPMLRKQKGFQHEVAFVIPNGADAVAISMWDLKENADAYARTTYPTVLTTLKDIIEGTPLVQTYDVCNSTFATVPVHATV